MALPSSGTISLGQVNVELGKSSTATISLGDSAVRTLAGRSSGSISMSHLRGKVNFAWTTNLSGSPASQYTYKRSCTATSSRGCSVTTNSRLTIKTDGSYTITGNSSGRFYNSSGTKPLYVKLVSKTQFMSTSLTSSWKRVTSDLTFTVTGSNSGSSNSTTRRAGTAEIQLSINSNGSSPVTRRFSLAAHAEVVDGWR